MSAPRPQGSAAKLAMLRKMGLVEYAIDYAVESADFEHAFQLAQQSGNAARLPDIHLKHAMFLEDEGQFADAERAFLQARRRPADLPHAAQRGAPRPVWC